MKSVAAFGLCVSAVMLAFAIEGGAQQRPAEPNDPRVGLKAGLRDAGEVVFSVARSVGWVAHALEEYDEPPLRFRGQGDYRGPRPPQPPPW